MPSRSAAGRQHRPARALAPPPSRYFPRPINAAKSPPRAYVSPSLFPAPTSVPAYVTGADKLREARAGRPPADASVRRHRRRGGRRGFRHGQATETDHVSEYVFVCLFVCLFMGVSERERERGREQEEEEEEKTKRERERERERGREGERKRATQGDGPVRHLPELCRPPARPHGARARACMHARTSHNLPPSIAIPRPPPRPRTSGQHVAPFSASADPAANPPAARHFCLTPAWKSARAKESCCARSLDDVLAAVSKHWRLFERICARI